MHNTNSQDRQPTHKQRSSCRTCSQTRAHWNAGQALAELVIACAILAITLFGIVTTINFSIHTVAVSGNKTRAIYYAQDGLEQARAARNASWTTFSSTNFLNSENDTSITGTIFRRTIAITSDNALPGNDDDRRVTSTVTWEDGAETYTTSLVVILTNR